MDAQFARWLAVIMLIGGVLGTLWGVLTLPQEEASENVIVFPGCDQCAEYA